MAYRKVVLGNYHPTAVMAAVRDFTCNPPKGFKVGLVDETLGNATLRRRANLFTWGDNVTIQVRSDPGGGSVVEIRSEPVVPTNVLDFGKNSRNVSTVEAEIRSR
ncbi:MAG: hypothetical protein LBU50_04555, partial [Cellulomonas sp.]|nr:hypothetical protein [Cellulomonas sp.]